MKTFKQLLKETIEMLKEDFEIAPAFGEENIRKEKGQSASAYQQIIGVLENMPEIDKILSERCGNVRAGETIAMCYKIFKHFNSKGKECNNITYDPKNRTYSANQQKNFGAENKNLISINKEFIKYLTITNNTMSFKDQKPADTNVVHTKITIHIKYEELMRLSKEEK